MIRICLLTLLLLVSGILQADDLEEETSAIRQKTAERSCWMLAVEKSRAFREIESGASKSDFIRGRLSEDFVLQARESQTDKNERYFENREAFQTVYFGLAYDIALEKISLHEAKANCVSEYLRIDAE